MTTAEDLSLADGLISLREAIATANGGSNNIKFSPTAFAAPRKTIALEGAELPPILGSLNVTITAPATGLILNAQNASRVFELKAGATATLSA